MRLTATGQAATGLAATDFDLQFVRSGEAASAKIDATLNGGGPQGPHLDNTVVEIDATDSKGVYRIDWPDNAFTANAREVICTVQVPTAFSESLRVELGPINLDTKLDRNADLTESQRGAHTWQGNWFYVDPVNGNTHASGNRGGRNDPYASIQDCHDNAVTDSNHDVTRTALQRTVQTVPLETYTRLSINDTYSFVVRVATSL
jgi:hypothetical protein